MLRRPIAFFSAQQAKYTKVYEEWVSPGGLGQLFDQKNAMFREKRKNFRTPLYIHTAFTKR